MRRPPRELWIFNQFAVSPDLPGGSRHFDLCRELVRRGYRTTIFASGFNYARHAELKLAPGEPWRIEDVDGVRFVWLRTLAYEANDWRRALNMVSFLREARRAGEHRLQPAADLGSPDVVIGSSVHLLAVLAAYRVARFHRARFIMEVRDLWPQTIVELGEMGERHPAIRAFRLLERFLYRRAERIITLLPHAQPYFASCGVPAEKVVWIPNGVELSRFGEAAGPAAAASQGSAVPTGTPFRVMYVGAHGKANALDNVLASAGMLQQEGSTLKPAAPVEIELVGDGAEKANLKQQARDLGLRNVVFRDPVAKNAVPAVLGGAHALLYNLENAPIFKYGISSNKLFDYMAASRPILFCANAGNNPVQEAGCGLTVPPRDPRALAAAILKLQRMSREEREAMGSRGRDYVQRNHAIPVLADRLIRCIEELAGER